MCKAEFKINRKALLTERLKNSNKNNNKNKYPGQDTIYTKRQKKNT